MEWYVKVPLAVLGVLELIIRLAVSPIVICLLGVSEREDLIGEFLRPWCFTHIQASESKKGSKETVLTLSQRRKLEYLRQEQEILTQRKATLAEINRLEGEIGAAFRPIS